jgi:hypothetical protein
VQARLAGDEVSTDEGITPPVLPVAPVRTRNGEPIGFACAHAPLVSATLIRPDVFAPT